MINSLIKADISKWHLIDYITEAFKVRQTQGDQNCNPDYYTQQNYLLIVGINESLPRWKHIEGIGDHPSVLQKTLQGTLQPEEKDKHPREATGNQ